MIDTPEFDEIYGSERLEKKCQDLTDGDPLTPEQSQLLADRLYQAKHNSGVHWNTLGKAIGINKLVARISEWRHGQHMSPEYVQKIKDFLDDK